MNSIVGDPNFELLGDLSSGDFQQKLYHWLEERGTLPILRTYLRHQLISTLKHTHPNSTLLNRKSNHLSPKVHAVNLLVAEHLLEQNYHFTVSILHSEEPRLGRLPSQIGPSAGSVDSSNYLQMKDVEDILGTLNLRTDSKLGRRVIDIYFGCKKKDKCTSLLRAIFEALCEGETLKSTGHGFSAGDTGSHGNKVDEEQLRDSSVLAGPSAKPTKFGIYSELQSPGNKEKTDSSHTQGESINRHLIEWSRNDFERRMKEEVRKVREDLEKEAACYKKKFKEEYLSKQHLVQEMINHVSNQLGYVKQHLKEIQNKEEELREREAKFEEAHQQSAALISSKHSDIVKAEQQLMEGFKRLAQEQDSFRSLQKEMEALRIQTMSENDGQSLNLLRSYNMQHEKNGDMKGARQPAGDGSKLEANLGNSVHSVQRDVVQGYKQIIIELKDKYEKLQKLADAQQSQINSLSSTASQQSKQLEEARAALRLLSSRDSHPSDVDAKNSIEERVTVLSMMQGDGKTEREGFWRQKEYSEGGFNRSRFLADSPRRNHARGRSTKYRRDSSESDSSSASSPTEEVIREARRRLQRLEKESDEVDKQFFKLRQKHLTEGGGSSGLDFSAFPSPFPESDPNLLLYNYMPAAQNLSLPIPPYQLVPGSVAVKVADGSTASHPHQRQGPAKNQAQFSVQSNVAFQHQSVGSWQSPLRSEVPTGSEPTPLTGGMYNNNIKRDFSESHSFQRESMGNMSHLAKATLPSSSEPPVLLENDKLNRTSKLDQKQILKSQNEFPVKDNQRSVHFEMTVDKKIGNNGQIREKNHLSAMTLETDTNKVVGPPEERLTSKRLEGDASVVMDPLSIPVIDLSKDSTHKKEYSNKNMPIHSPLPPQELSTNKTQISVSSEDSSSTKLSIGVDDAKEDDSDIW